MVTLEHAMRHKPIGHALRFCLLGSLSECQCFSLGEDIRHEHVMMPTQWIGRLRKSNKVARNESRSLVNELIERMLAIGSWLAPVNGTSVIRKLLPIEPHVFAVALHGQLLKICGKPL